MWVGGGGGGSEEDSVQRGMSSHTVCFYMIAWVCVCGLGEGGGGVERGGVGPEGNVF